MQDDPNDAPQGAQSSSNDQPTQSKTPGYTSSDAIPPRVQPGHPYGPPPTYEQPYAPTYQQPAAYQQPYQQQPNLYTQPTYTQPTYTQPTYTQPPAYVPPQAAYGAPPYQGPNYVMGQAPQPRMRDRARAFGEQHKVWTAVIASVIAIFALCAVCTFCSALYGAISAPPVDVNTAQTQQQQHQQQVTQPTQAPQPTATPKPTATPNVNASATAWKNMAASDAQTLADDSNAIGTSCGDEDLEGCLSDTQTFQADVESFQADLNAHPAPPCLTATNAYLKQALADYDKGAGDVIDGINNIDANLISRGSTEIQKGTPLLNKSTAAMQNASC